MRTGLVIRQEPRADQSPGEEDRFGGIAAGPNLLAYVLELTAGQDARVAEAERGNPGGKHRRNSTAHRWVVDSS